MAGTSVTLCGRFDVNSAARLMTSMPVPASFQSGASIPNGISITAANRLGITHAAAKVVVSRLPSKV